MSVVPDTKALVVKKTSFDMVIIDSKKKES
jgi:hypothetical protein